MLPDVSVDAMLEALSGDRRAVEMRVGGEQRWIASEDAGLYRDAFGAVPPGGLPAAFLDETPGAVRSGWCAASRAPTGRSPPASCTTASRWTPRRCCRRWRATAAWCAASCARAAREREWCDTDVLRRLRRASLAALRKEVEPAEQQALARFLPSWQGVDTSPPGGAGVDRLREVLVPLQGVALAPAVWEQDVLPRRAGRLLGRVAGPAVRVGRGGVGGRRHASAAATGKVALYFREDAPLIGPPNIKGDPPEGEVHDAIRERLRAGASFWTDLLADLAHEPTELQEALWDLVWAGEVTNDAFAPLRAPRLSLAREQGAQPRRFSRRRRPGTPQVQGRWSLTDRLFAGAPEHSTRMRAISELLLERYGIVTRETVLAEGIPGGFSSLYGELANLETLGTARRGYFVEGLGGAQFALPAAIERLRGLRSR